jgi:integrase
MNARRRSRPDGLPSRVYMKGTSYYWVRTDNRWIRLSKVTDGDVKMFERLAAEKRAFEPIVAGRGNIPAIVGTYMEQKAMSYAESFRDEWRRRGEGVRSYFRDWNIERVDASAVEDFLLNNWPERLSMQKAMKAWLSTFFSWAVRKKFVTVNPTREVKVKKPKKRNVYIPDEHFLRIREWLVKYTYVLHEDTPDKREVTGSVPTGPMMQCFIDLCYLTCQRSTEIRLLRWEQVDREAGVIHFVPTKTADSSGEAVDWPITPDIDAVLNRARLLAPTFGQKYVIRDRRGQAKSDQACRDAWEGAMQRAGLADKPYTIKDIRAKAMTDAKRAGYDLEALQVAGAHTDRSTTEGYIKSREVPVSTVVLHLPAGKAD